MKKIIEYDKLFTELFTDLIKPFSMILGENALRVAYKVFDEAINKYSEILKINKNGFQIIINFKTNTKDKKKIEVVRKIISELKKAFINESGNVARKMIDFAIKDYVIKYNLNIN